MHVKIELGKREFRLLLDLVYTGNWVLNSQRGPDRIGEYDAVASKIFAFCREAGMPRLSVMDGGIGYPFNHNGVYRMDGPGNRNQYAVDKREKEEEQLGSSILV